MKRVCVFLGSSPGARPAYAEAARGFARELAARELELVYGGGNVGLMGILADGMMAAGGHVIGVIPAALAALEVAHTGIPDLRIVDSMHERKAMMADLADAFVSLPGGLGSYEEFFEVLTWAQLGMHQKPCALLDVAGYWEPLRGLLAHAVEERFVRTEHLELLLVSESPASLLDACENHRVRPVEKWIDRGQI